MNERPPLDATVDIPPAGDHLDAGLAAAFGPDSRPPLPAGGSVLKALSAGLPSVPRILLREPESFGGSPIVRPSSEEMPDKQDPAARLQLHGEIARGGMGAVLKGRDVDLGRDVAVKVLLETHVGKTEMLQRFVEEAQISGQLQHPGIAPIYELGQFVDKRPYFTMKLVKGKTLATLLAARKTPGEEQSRFVGIFAQICQTLAYAHARGVIHRDLKPSNVMVGAFGEVQVMDWGLAKVLKEGGIADELRSRERDRAEVSIIRTQRSEGSSTPEAGSHTQAGTVLGTPAYMAPEQARGDVDLVDERADVFGLGAILCEILTGQPPYVGKGAEVQYKSRTAKLGDALARLDACGADAELLALARRCLAAELWERPRDAGAVAAEVTAYQNAVTERLRAAELGRAAEEARALEARATAAQERKARRMTLALAATVLLTVLLGGVGGMWLRGQIMIRLAANNLTVKEALTQAASLREQARNAQGRAASELSARAREEVRRAEAVVQSGPADSALEAQVGQLLADLEADEKDAQLLAALDAARLAQAETNAEKRGFARERAVPLFREAFRVYGMAAGEEEAAAAAARLGQRPAAVRDAVLAAVDEWIDLAENASLKIREPQLDWLRAVQAAAEPEGWGKQLREAAAIKDAARRRAALEKLAESAEMEHLPAQALARLAQRLWGVQAEASAVALLRRAQPRHAGDFWINEELGCALYKQLPAEAVRYYTAAVALRPDSAAAHSNLGVALWGQGHRDEAIAEYKKAIELDPKYAMPHSNLGNALRDQGQGDAAIAECRKAIELDPKFASVHNNLGRALAEQGHRDEAIAEYKKAIELDPKLALAHNNLGRSLAEQGHRDEAIAEYKKAIELDPKYAMPHSNLGNALRDQGQRDAAIAEYKKAIELDPRLALAHNNLGGALAQQGHRGEAIAEFKKAIELDPKLASAYSNLGLVLAEQGHRGEAIAEYKKAIELDPKWALAHSNLGGVLAQQGQRDEAIAEFKKAIELDPKLAPAHNNLGKELRDQGQRDAAIAEFKKAIELDPKFALAHNNLGNALAQQGHRDEAIAEYKKAIELDPKLALAHNNLGGALAQQGHRDEAIAEYRKAIELDPKFALAHCGLGLILLQQGRFAEAEAALKRGHELGSRQPGWRYPSAQWLRNAEQAAALADKLPALIRGDYQPRDNAERLGLIQVCLPTKHYAAAARLYADAFAADAKLAGDWKAGHRYNAACFAALAAAAADTDADKRDEKERSRLRQQARDWLRADLTAYGKLLDGGKAEDRTLLRQKLQHWQGDPDLNSIRDAKELAKLPANERQTCEKLWADVATLLAKTQSKR